MRFRYKLSALFIITLLVALWLRFDWRRNAENHAQQLRNEGEVVLVEHEAFRSIVRRYGMDVNDRNVRYTTNPGFVASWSLFGKNEEMTRSGRTPSLIRWWREFAN